MQSGIHCNSFQLTMKSSPSVLTEACCISFNTCGSGLRFSKCERALGKQKKTGEQDIMAATFDAGQ